MKTAGYPDRTARPRCVQCKKPLAPVFVREERSRTEFYCGHRLSTGKACDASRSAHYAWMPEKHEYTEEGGREYKVMEGSVETDEILWFGHPSTANLFCTLRCGVEWAVTHLGIERAHREDALREMNRTRPS